MLFAARCTPAAATAGGQHSTACCRYTAQVATAAARSKPSARPTQQQQFKHATTCRGVLNVDMVVADSWSLASRAGILNMTEDELERLIDSDSDAAWMAVCRPERLFALRQVCRLMGVDVEAATRLVQQEPALLEVPAKALEDNARGIQALLQLSQPALLQLLVAAPSLAVAGPKAVEAQLQRVAWDLGLSAAGPEADLLLQVVPALGLDALLDHQVAAQRVSAFMSTMSLGPGDAMTLLAAELAAGGPTGMQDLLAEQDSLAQEWRVLSESLRLPLHLLMPLLVAQVAQPDARYLVSSTLRLWADITTLHTACQLQPATACRMLLAAPRLAGTPASFWQLLLQYVLFLVPQWRQELKTMKPEQAGVVLAQLFDASGGDVCDEVLVSAREALFVTADFSYNQELQVVEALLDQGVQAPRFAAPGRVVAGRVWRLLYICNPRLAAAQQAPDRSPSGGPWSWSWLLNMQLPQPLRTQLQQQQQQGVRVASRAPSGSMSASGGGRVAAEGVESLAAAITADTQGFCDRHPGYAHWLHNAAFELEWAGSKAAVDVTTWDP